MEELLPLYPWCAAALHKARGTLPAHGPPRLPAVNRVESTRNSAGSHLRKGRLPAEGQLAVRGGFVCLAPTERLGHQDLERFGGHGEEFGGSRDQLPVEVDRERGIGLDTHARGPPVANTWVLYELSTPEPP